MKNPEVIRRGALSMQVCVPKEYTDEQVMAFAEGQYPCGTQNGWHIRTAKSLLNGYPSRNPCAENSDAVHITLDA